MTVIEHEFGKTERDKVRRFTKLVTLEAQHEAKVLANPLPYLERAEERITQLEMALTEAANAAAYDPPGHVQTGEKIEVNKAEYERLLRAKALLDAAVGKL